MHFANPMVCPAKRDPVAQIAQLAVKGHAVYELADGGFLVCKYGYIHHAQDFEALQVFAHRFGVSK
jgi:hypothetical protein